MNETDHNLFTQWEQRQLEEQSEEDELNEAPIIEEDADKIA